MAIKKESNPLLKALQFLNRIGEKLGLEYEKHCLFQRGFIIGMNSTGVTCAIKCEYPTGFEGFAPNVAQLHSVLSRFQPEKVTQQDNDTLRIESGRLKATVNCFPPIQFMIDDTRRSISPCNELLTAALLRCSRVAQGVGVHAHSLGGVHVADGCATGSNGRVILQVWHGCEVATPIIIPRESCELFAAYHSQPVGIANDHRVVIIYYADGSWLRSSLVADKYPSVEKVLIYDQLESVFPVEFFEALNAVRPFLESNEFYIDGDKIFSDLEEKKSTSFDLVLDECQRVTCYNAEYMDKVKDEINHYHICPETNRFYFSGTNSRGCMIGIVPRV